MVSDQKPLIGRTILVTRALEQSSRLERLLEANGARVVLCPTIKIIDLDTYELIDNALEHLYEYDWLIFTSVNGVEHFMRRLRAKGHQAGALDDLRVCAIGDATGERLIQEHVHVDIIPVKSKAEGILAALELFLGGSARLAGLNFLIPRAALARDYLPRALQRAGARADVAPVYRTAPVAYSDSGRLRAMISGGAIDCITFLSSSAIVNFAGIFDGANLSGLLEGVVIASIGDITSSTIATYGLRATIQSDTSTIHSLVDAIVDHFSPQK